MKTIIKQSAAVIVILLTAMVLPIRGGEDAIALYRVTRVIDGDTVVLSDNRIVRLIGVDTPETHDSPKLQKDCKRAGLTPQAIKTLGEKAKAFTTGLCLGKLVYLEYDKNMHGRYGRTLAYLYLTDGTCINEEIIRNGFGIAFMRYAFKYKVKYKYLQQEAIEHTGK